MSGWIKFKNLKRLALATLIAITAPLTAQAGGFDGGGNGVFISSSRSQNLVFWDLYVHAPNFADNQPGDQMVFRAPLRPQTPNQGEVIDYREFASFKLLKRRLALWSTRAKNLVSLIEADDFVGSAGTPDKYRLILVGTPLFVQVLNEIAVPDWMLKKEIAALPGATYEEKEAAVYVNQQLWNQAGLVSQAALLLHERLRTFQIYFRLPNKDLQRLVSLIMLREPGSVSNADYNDEDFSKSGVVSRPEVSTDWAQLSNTMSLVYSTRFHDKIFECLKVADAKGCLREYWKTLPNSPEASRFPEQFPVLMFLGYDYYVDRMVKAGFLGPMLKKLKLVSTGKHNQPIAPPPAGATFTKMYGLYKILKCTNRGAAIDANFDPCKFEELRITPIAQKPEVTSLGLSRQLLPKGSSTASFVSFQPARKASGETYVESGHEMASFKGPSAELTITREGKSARYVLKFMTHWMNQEQNQDLELLLEKQ